MIYLKRNITTADNTGARLVETYSARCHCCYASL